MANWMRTVKLNPEWDQAQEGAISAQALAASVARKLKLLRKFDDEDIDYRLEELVFEFEGMGKCASTTISEFDGFMTDLYDWADTKISGGFFDAKKVCWIDTMSSVPTSSILDRATQEHAAALTRARALRDRAPR